MKISNLLIIFCFLISLQSIFMQSSCAVDTITSLNSLKYGNSSDTLVSSGQTFELGFFSSPRNSTNRYLAIWYKITPEIIIWVANRNKPLNDSFGELTINNKGNLVLLNREKIEIWSSNSSLQIVENAVSQLLDSGNLVVRESKSESFSDSYLWQSFDHPSDTLLPGMKLGWDMRIGLQRNLTAWKSQDDPSDGDFTYSMELISGLVQFLSMSVSTRKKTLRIGPWNGVEFNGYPHRSNAAYSLRYVMNEYELYFTFEPEDETIHTRITFNHTGQLQMLYLHNNSNEWNLMYLTPFDSCDDYNRCGNNGMCDFSGDPICQCLEGFQPSSPDEWKFGNRKSGCVRKTPLNCSEKDGFVKFSTLRLPDLLRVQLNESYSLKSCKNDCSKNCSCVAYANSDVRGSGSGCLMWFGDLIDVRMLRLYGAEQDIYLKLSASDIKSIGDGNKRKRLKIIIATSISSVIFISVLLFLTWKFLRVRGKSEDDNENIDLPLFDFATIRTATKDFCSENLLGEGGFGPVYKGNLSNGQEIAVKRLSKNSRQGLKEFKNEVELIAKLQHKNLVALLGCCVEGDERILIYEYMPCKSLDHYIFDKKKSNLSSWEKNFEILMGIARGFLYLHQDSKLPIIHRDLKASNVLLDCNMNPKISDFGLARIFGGDEKENRTQNIVGTYGYISPEYLVDGRFSVKFDVFSFGVMLIEIVSGKKNRFFTHDANHRLNLIGHAWLLWKQGQATEIIDPCFDEFSVESRVLRCIQVGLLCVQKYSEDRPTINSVVLMLSNDGMKLPQPKEPGFFMERSQNYNNESSTLRNNEIHSLNTMTVTLEGRR